MAPVISHNFQKSIQQHKGLETFTELIISWLPEVQREMEITALHLSFTSEMKKKTLLN